jgi:hypothetical protein
LGFTEDKLITLINNDNLIGTFLNVDSCNWVMVLHSICHLHVAPIHSKIFLISPHQMLVCIEEVYLDSLLLD